MQSDKVAAQERVKHAARALCNAQEGLNQAKGKLAQAQDTAAAALKLRDQHKQLVRWRVILESLCTVVAAGPCTEKRGAVVTTETVLFARINTVEYRFYAYRVQAQAQTRSAVVQGTKLEAAHASTLQALQRCEPAQAEAVDHASDPNSATGGSSARSSKRRRDPDSSASECNGEEGMEATVVAKSTVQAKRVARARAPNTGDSALQRGRALLQELQAARDAHVAGMARYHARLAAVNQASIEADVQARDDLEAARSKLDAARAKITELQSDRCDVDSRGV